MLWAGVRAPIMVLQAMIRNTPGAAQSPLYPTRAADARTAW